MTTRSTATAAGQRRPRGREEEQGGEDRDDRGLPEGWTVATDGRHDIPSTSFWGDGDRLTTPEELELIATSARDNGDRQSSSSSGTLLVLPTQRYEETSTSEDSSSSTTSSYSSSEDLLNDRGGAAERQQQTLEEEEFVLLEESEDGDGDVDVDGDNNQQKKGRSKFRIFRYVSSSGASSSATKMMRRKGGPRPTMDVEQYMSKRKMTAQQERWNAYTMVPSPIYCLLYLLAGLWINPDMVIEEHKGTTMTGTAGTGFTGFANDLVGDSNGCLNWNTIEDGAESSWWVWSFFFKYLRFLLPAALPPLPVLAVAIAIIVHAPFSFIYHFKYAHALPPGSARTTHWSRRADQAMIHVASTFMSYATSGSTQFFIANVLYNADCVYRLFLRKVRPRRNQIRIIISCLAYTIPILRRGDFILFGHLWTLLGIAFYIFGRYPFGGWSHSIFHLVMAFVPPLLMNAACQLPASQQQLRIAAYCVATNANAQQ